MSKYVGLTVLHPGGLKATQRLAETCGVNEGSLVLDLGCGKGTSAIYLAEHFGCKVQGIDISQDSINHAQLLAGRKNLEDRVSFRTGDALHLPFDDGQFDVVVSQALLVLVPNKAKVVREALRVAKPSGRVGWLELSWKETPPQSFMKEVSEVICAYCMLNVETFQGWETLFRTQGTQELNTNKRKMEFNGLREMLHDEGVHNSLRIIRRYLTNGQIRRRMRRTARFFHDNPQYFGYGIYVGSSPPLITEKPLLIPPITAG
jgi:ubiquinone/menaquinone biosynthesis C-methylase UbiE